MCYNSYGWCWDPLFKNVLPGSVCRIFTPWLVLHTQKSAVLSLLGRGLTLREETFLQKFSQRNFCQRFSGLKVFFNRVFAPFKTGFEQDDELYNLCTRRSMKYPSHQTPCPIMQQAVPSVLLEAADILETTQRKKTRREKKDGWFHLLLLLFHSKFSWQLVFPPKDCRTLFGLSTS